MGEGAVLLMRAPAFSAALDHAAARWDERGGLLVVPSQEAAADALRAATARGPVVGREAITFAALRGRVAAAAGGSEPEVPSRVETRLALREVLDEADLGFFGPSADAPGFLTGVERALGELRVAAVAADRLRDAAADPVSAALADLHTRSGDRVPHPADALWSAVDACHDLEAFPPVTVSGFDDLVPGQWALLRALARVTPVEVVMPFAPERYAHEARRERQRAWEAGCRAVSIAAEPEGPGRLAAGLFEPGEPRGELLDLRLVGTAGTAGMLRGAVEEALDAAEAGTPLDRVALVVPRLAEVRAQLERLLDDWQVPATMSTRIRVLEAPVALALTHLLYLGEADRDDPGTLDHLLGWLRSPYSGADPAEVDLFEVHARRGRLTRGQMLARWDGEAIAPARRMVRAAQAGPRAQVAAMLDAGWDALRRHAEGGRPPGRADLHDRAALSALAGVTRAWDDDGADDPAEAGSRARGPLPPGELGAIIADLTATIRTRQPGGLHVHDFASIRGRRYDVVVIAGLDGDGYPARPAADPFLAALRPALGDDLPARAPGTSESRMRFVHAVDAARRALRLVRRLVDDDGRETAPSPYWVEACRLAGRGIDDLDRRTGARGEVPEDGDRARTEREALRAIAIGGGGHPGALDQAASRRARPVGVPADAFLDRDRFRVTEIEAFLGCAYGWFHARVLAPQAIEAPFDAAFEGSFGHTLLERTYGAMRSTGTGPCGPTTVAAYRQELDRQAAGLDRDERPPGAGPAWTAMVERMRRHLSAMLGREAALGSRFVPTHFEERIESTIILGAVAPGVAVSGQLDRLDVSPSGDHLLVIDYKRSGADFDPGSKDVMKRLQLPIYARMAREALEPGAEPAGGLYMGMLTPRTTGAVRDVPGAPSPPSAKRGYVHAAVWDAITDEAVEVVRDAVARIRRGELEPPGPTGCPPWCMCGDLWR